MIKTKIDRIASMIKERPMSIKEIANQLDISQEIVEIVGRNLEARGIMKLEYPPVGSPILSLSRLLEEEYESAPTSYDERYSYIVNGINVNVFIYRDKERRPFYHVIYNKPAPYTLEFLLSLEAEISRDIPLDTSYFLTPEKVQAYLPVVYRKIKEKLSTYFSEHLDSIAGYIFINMYGMKELEILMGDENLEEISVNTANLPIAVYHRGYGWMKTNLKINDEEEIANIASQIARRVGQQITIANPILDAFLTTGDRATATLYPASTNGNTITIRKFAKDPWTVTKFIANHTLSVEMAALLWQAVHYEMNIIATGGTASGKTSMLNIMMQLTPPYQRVVSIEETREIAMPEHIWNWIPLLVREVGPATEVEKVKISMADLLVTSLRMRPDRIILGEVRSPDEAKVLFDAMHTGHSVSTTFHADSAAQMLKRMLEPPFSIHATEVESIHLIVVQHRDRRRNLRRTFEISELSPGLEGSLSTNRLFIWRPRTDRFEEINKPRRYIEDINIYTGMTEREIYDDLSERKQILEWMVRQKYFDISQVSEVTKAYYSTPDILMDAVIKDKELEGVQQAKQIPAQPSGGQEALFKKIKKEEISDVIQSITREIETSKGVKKVKRKKR
ncbi:MAG: type II/IV secretion system ATPase subunit [Candidatus Micrarchaeota archaeon]|nr:type II/IV secretion system ATPase subunit [Candidatus Micrarchaeota archaeon]